MFIGIWNFADDYGRHPYSAKQVKAEVFPADNFTEQNILGMFEELEANGLITLYSVENTRYFYITGWHHQRIDKPQKPKYPDPFGEHSESIPRTLPPDRIGKDKIREDKIAEPIGSNASAPTDFRKELFGRGLRVLTEITGKTPDSSRSLVGRWLKFVNDEAIHVLGAIEEAERNKIADPVAWITKVLQSKMGNRDGKPTVHDAAKAQLERFRSLNEPSGLRDGAGTNPVRLLPTR